MFIKLIFEFGIYFSKQVLEIRPTIKWDKGKALEFLLESLGEFSLHFTIGPCSLNFFFVCVSNYLVLLDLYLSIFEKGKLFGTA